MKTAACECCENTEIPLNDATKIDGRVYCPDCLKSAFSDSKELEGRKIEYEHDPTICSSCKSDFGNLELNKISNYPICSNCETKIKNRTFPLWVKAFFIAILAIVTFSFFWNWRYYQAYNNIKQSNVYFEKGDFSNAARLMADASVKAPEVQDIKTLSTYFNGLRLMATDSMKAALAELEKCKSKLPPDFNIGPLITQARMGAAFDDKDYEGFLNAGKDNLALDPNNASSWAAVASAYSCIYVDKGDENAKTEAYKYLNKAHAIDSASDEMKLYTGLVEYRIFAKRIITREDFIKLFPNGWTKN